MTGFGRGYTPGQNKAAVELDRKWNGTVAFTVEWEDPQGNIYVDAMDGPGNVLGKYVVSPAGDIQVEYEESVRTIKITKEFKIPGTDVVLEAGDRIKVIEAFNSSAWGRRPEIASFMIPEDMISPLNELSRKIDDLETYSDSQYGYGDRDIQDMFQVSKEEVPGIRAQAAKDLGVATVRREKLFKDLLKRYPYVEATEEILRSMNVGMYLENTRIEKITPKAIFLGNSQGTATVVQRDLDGKGISREQFIATVLSFGG